MDDSFFRDILEQDSYKEIKLTNNLKRVKSKFQFEKTKIDEAKSMPLTEKQLSNNLEAIELESKDIVVDQLDEFEDEVDLSKDDYIQMALHYKALCKSYKKQLIESRKTIRELNFTIEHLERKAWSQKSQKLKAESVKNEQSEHLKTIIDKCVIYCEKINQYVIETSDDDSACPNDKDYSETKDELILKTLQNILKEKKEIKNFFKPFKSLVELINPTSDDVKNFNSTNFTHINNILKDTLEYVSNNSLEKFHCKCNGVYDFNKQTPKSVDIDNKRNYKKSYNRNISSASSSSSLGSSLSSHKEDNFDYYKHKPSQEFLINTLTMFQKLFDVDCFLNVPTKMNDLYYKYGQLLNFKKAIQNIFDQNENWSTEKLVCNIQNIYKLLNDRITSNLKGLLNSSNLEKVVDKFLMYDEYFPLFHKLLEQIMNALEISRLDQIMPSIRALKILATPTIC